jgi:hypothetical protein
MPRGANLNEEPREPAFDDSLNRDLPIDHYPDLSVEQILIRALSLSPEEIENVVDYERRHQRRKIVLDNIERIAA